MIKKVVIGKIRFIVTGFQLSAVKYYCRQTDTVCVQTLVPDLLIILFREIIQNPSENYANPFIYSYSGKIKPSQSRNT